MTIVILTKIDHKNKCNVVIEPKDFDPYNGRVNWIYPENDELIIFYCYSIINQIFHVNY